MIKYSFAYGSLGQRVAQMHSKAPQEDSRTILLLPRKNGLVFITHSYILFALKVTTYKGRFPKAVTSKALPCYSSEISGRQMFSEIQQEQTQRSQKEEAGKT